MPTTNHAPGARAGWEALLSRAGPAGGRLDLEVASLWGDTLLELRRFAPDGEFALGEGPARHTLVRRAQGGPELVPPEDARVALCGTELPRDAAAALRLRPGQPVRVEVGRLTYLVRYAGAEPRLRPDPRDRDFRFTKVLLATALAAGALLFAWSLTGAGADALSDEVVLHRPEIKLKVLSQPTPPKPTLAVKPAQAAPRESTPRPAARVSTEPTRPGDRGRQHERLQHVGLLGAIHELGPASASVFGNAGLGADVSAALAGLQGDRGYAGDPHGVGGSRGPGGPGGPGGVGDLGIGGPGTRDGHGPGGGGDILIGGPGHDRRERVRPQEPKVVGGLEAAEIQRVIQRHQNEVRFCFNTEFQKNPELGGKLAVRFTIGADGSVSDADADQNTTQSAEVEACVLARVRRWRFPEPKGGGVVVVTYPWIFSGAGAE